MENVVKKSVTELKKDHSIGKKWEVGTEYTLVSGETRETRYGTVSVFTTTEGEKVFCSGIAILDFIRNLTPEDYPIQAKLVQRTSDNKRSYFDLE